MQAGSAAILPREIAQAPHSPPDRATMRGIEGIKEVRLISPAEVMLNLVMKIRRDRPVGFFMIALER